MNKQLSLLIFEIQIEVWQSHQIFVGIFAEARYFDSRQSAAYLEASVISSQLSSDFVDFVFK